MSCESRNSFGHGRDHEQDDFQLILGKLDRVTVEPVNLLTLKLLVLARRDVIKLHEKCDHVDRHEDVGGQGDQRSQLSLVRATTFVMHSDHVPVHVLSDNDFLESLQTHCYKSQSFQFII